MPYSSGAYTPASPEYPAVAGTVIVAADFNTIIQDIADALSIAWPRDGQAPPTANMPMNGFRFTGVGDAAARTDYVSWGQLQDNEAHFVDTVGGTANAVTASVTPGITALEDGQILYLPIALDNTGAVTLATNGQAATAVKKDDGYGNLVDLAAGDWQAGHVAIVLMEAGIYQWLNRNDANALKLTGNQTAAGTKTFSGDVNVGGAFDVNGAATFDGSADFDGDVDLTGATILGRYPFVFEGLTADAFETTFEITDPTADRTITFPDASGTVVLAGGSGSLTKFESAEQVIAMGTVYTLAHGLGGVPFGMSAILRCVNSEYGYIAGDEVVAPLPQNDNTGASANFHDGVGIAADGTNLYLVTNGSGDQQFLRIARKSAPIGDVVIITNANWKLVGRAWK